MYTSIKSIIAACMFLALVSIPLSAGADAFVFSGKGASGTISGMNGNLYMRVSVFENTTQSDSNKVNSSGAYFSGSNYNYIGSVCWFGYGFTDTIEFKATGPLPNQVIASGAILVTWYDWCNSNFATETVSFTMNSRAIKNQASKNWGITHSEYGNIKYNDHFSYSYAPAVVDASSISSPTFGIVIPNYGDVGQSEQRNVDITR